MAYKDNKKGTKVKISQVIWESIRKDLELGGLDYHQCAKKYGVLYKTILNKSSKEKWRPLFIRLKDTLGEDIRAKELKELELVDKVILAKNKEKVDEIVDNVVAHKKKQIERWKQLGEKFDAKLEDGKVKRISAGEVIEVDQSPKDLLDLSNVLTKCDDGIRKWLLDEDKNSAEQGKTVFNTIAIFESIGKLASVIQGGKQNA